MSTNLVTIDGLAESETMERSESILERIAQGDSLAVSDCLRKYGNLVWSMARRWSSDSADAEDAAQEIFVDLWQSASRYRPHAGNETTFVMMIARRRLIDRLRQRQTRSALLSLSEDQGDFAAPVHSNPAEVADEAAKAAACMEQLTEQTQKVLLLSIQSAASHSEIAKHLDLPLGSVKSFARRGLLMLRDCMGRSPKAVSQGANL